MEFLFLMGILPRCGTNYLARLLELNAEVCRPDGHWELPLLGVADEFGRFHGAFLRRRESGRLNYTLDDFAGCFGDGLIRLLSRRVPSSKNYAPFLLHKNPLTDGLEHFRRFFPTTKLVFLIRDGRDNVNSLLSAKGVHAPRWRPRRLYFLRLFARQWAASARRIREFAERDENCIVIRFEDLIRDLEPNLRRVASFYRLNVTQDWLEAARKLPITGSSFYRATDQGATEAAEGGTTWDTLEASPEFQPVGRWQRSWSKVDLAVFRTAAAGEMEAWNYAVRN